ncbi:MAG: hypothetical protein HYX40_10150 [Sphingobacteriales bacterium]|nr:hypothetical protein [Sphingobacteriales bacterium]
MNTRILLLGLAAASFTSCATVYKTGQTPDDVYYSPAKPEEEYVKQEERDENNRRDYYTLDDYRLRMQMRNRTRYCACSDDWYYDNWNTSNSWRYGWNNPWTWNTGSGWYYSYNSWSYAPYPSYTTNITTTKTFNYKPPIRNFGNSNTVPATYNEKAGYTVNQTTKPVKVYNNSNKNGGFGNFMRQIFTPSGNSGSTSSGNNSRTYSPSSSSGSSGSSRSSGSSSSGSSSSRPARNGKG